MMPDFPRTKAEIETQLRQDMEEAVYKALTEVVGSGHEPFGFRSGLHRLITEAAVTVALKHAERNAR